MLLWFHIRIMVVLVIIEEEVLDLEEVEAEVGQTENFTVNCVGNQGI